MKQTVRCQTKVHTQRRIFRARGENQKDKRKQNSINKRIFDNKTRKYKSK